MLRAEASEVELPGGHSKTATSQHRVTINRDYFTFITTFKPCSFRIRGANTEWRYASRLYLMTVSFDTQAKHLQFYLANAANIAIAGGCSTKDDQSPIHDAKIGRTIGSLEDGWNKVRLVGVMERGNRELELVGKLRGESLSHHRTERQIMHVPSRKRPSPQLHNNAFEPK